jgi:hypothetical protein
MLLSGGTVVGHTGGVRPGDDVVQAYLPSSEETEYGVPASELRLELAAEQPPVPDDMDEAEVLRARQAVLARWREAARLAEHQKKWLAENQAVAARTEVEDLQRNEEFRLAWSQRECGHTGPEGSAAHQGGLRCEQPRGHKGLHEGPRWETYGGTKTYRWDDAGAFPRVKRDPESKWEEKGVVPCGAPWPKRRALKCKAARGHEHEHWTTAPETRDHVFWPQARVPAQGGD